MQSENSIQNLLSQVSIINNKYIELANQTGENFNIFRILKLSSSEVRLHSALLAELLNPRGSHGMKDAFLKLFIQKILPIEPNEFDNYKTENANVEVEKWIGYIDSENHTGGYIDIHIQMTPKTIIIENKIYAGDQDSQLRRYYNYNTNSNLIYLTLYGTEASEVSTKNKEHPKDPIPYFKRSYSKHINEWLEQCKKEAVDYPIVRETIKQYIYLIKHLTNQTINENMKKDIIDKIIETPENIKSAQEIADNWKECQYEIITSLKVDIKNVAKELDLEYEIDDTKKLGENGSGFWFYDNKNWKVYCIYFYFNMDITVINIRIDPEKFKCPENIETKLKNHFANFEIGGIADHSWTWCSEFKEWSNIISWADIKKEIPNAILETTRQIKGKLNEFKP